MTRMFWTLYLMRVMQMMVFILNFVNYAEGKKRIEEQEETEGSKKKSLFYLIDQTIVKVWIHPIVTIALK